VAPADLQAKCSRYRHSQPSGSGVQQPVTQPQPPLTSGGGAADDAHSGAVLSTDGASGVASPPTAPPLYPTVQHPSSPLMADPMYSKVGLFLPPPALKTGTADAHCRSLRLWLCRGSSCGAEHSTTPQVSLPQLNVQEVVSHSATLGSSIALTPHLRS
jgi:hypothetical protein